MGEKVLGSFFDEYGTLGLTVSLISITIAKIMGVIGWPVVGIFALNRFQQASKAATVIQPDTRRIFNWVMLLAFINASLIMVSQFILSGRYIVALGLILLILAAFKLDNLLSIYAKSKAWHKVLLAILIALLTVNMIKNVLPKGAGYNFEQEAVAYLKQQQVPNNKVFFADYTERGYEYWDYIQKAINSGEINQYDYLLLNIDIDAQYAEKQQFLNQQLSQYKLEKEFYGYKKKKKIMLYSKILTY
jgi:hypothetical protein